MRDISYRAKRKDNGEWVYGVPLKEGYSQEVEMLWYEYGSLAYTERVQVIPQTVGQYTGLTDKNGKKIFEGDIVRADDYIFSIKYGKCGGTPNTDNYGYMGFYLEAVSEGTKLCSHYGLRDDICFFTDIEIIGNIWDNSVML